jgi:hypothetical protein
LGYVTFELDLVTGAATPLNFRKGLEHYQFDFRTVKVVENTATTISIQLPTVYRDQEVVMGAPIVSSDKTGFLTLGAGGIVGDDPNNLLMFTAMALEYRGDKTFWVLGFRHASIPPNLLRPKPPGPHN